MEDKIESQVEEIATRLNGDRFQLSQEELKAFFPVSITISTAIRAVAMSCPDNYERQRALDCLDSSRSWVEKSIKRN